MTRYRITVRGDGIELRGYADADATYEVHRLLADDIDERAEVLLSVEDDDYEPFEGWN